jgi:hypothetical protein
MSPPPQWRMALAAYDVTDAPWSSGASGRWCPGHRCVEDGGPVLGGWGGAFRGVPPPPREH